MPSQYDYDLIRDYLHGLLDKSAAGEIGELIERDEVARGIAEGILLLERNFASEQEVDAYLENFRHVQMRTIHRTVNEGKQKRRLLMKVAASVSILALIVYIIRSAMPGPDVMAMVDEQLSTPYAVVNVVRSAGDPTPFDLGIEQYTAGNYTEALRYFRMSAGSTADLATLTFYEALSHLYAGHYKDASHLLQTEVIAGSRYAQQARWHLALAALKMNDHELARKTLAAIVADKRHYKYDMASSLYDAL